MNEPKEARRIVDVFADLRVNPKVLAGMVYNQITEDVTIRLYQFIQAYVTLLARDNHPATEKTSQIREWARKVDNV